MECPCRKEDVHPWFTRYKLPSVKVGFQSGQFGFHGIPPFFSMRTVDGLWVGRTVRGVSSQGGRKDVRLNICDGKGSMVIHEVRLEVGQEGGKKAVAMGGTKTGPVMLEEGKLRELTMSYACSGVVLGMVSSNIGHGRRELGP